MDQRQNNLSVLSTLETSKMPIISLNDLISHNSQARSVVVEKLHQACKEMGFFQITNHGISKSVIEDALGSSVKFFDLPIEEKNVFSSEDVFRPVRYATIRSNDVVGGGVISREFIKLYAYPVQDYVDMWPHKPAECRYFYRIRLKKLRTLRHILTVVGVLGDLWPLFHCFKDLLKPYYSLEFKGLLMGSNI